MSAEEGKNGKVHACKLCSVSFENRKDYQEHRWSLLHHTNLEAIEKGEHTCNLCGAKGSSLVTYKAHLEGKKHKRNLAQWKGEDMKQANILQHKINKRQKKEDWLKRRDLQKRQDLEEKKHGQIESFGRGKQIFETQPRNILYPPTQHDNWHQPWKYPYFGVNTFPQANRWINENTVTQNTKPPSLFSVGRGRGVFSPNARPYRPGNSNHYWDQRKRDVNVSQASKNPSFARGDGKADSSTSDIEDFRSSIAKKADLTTPCSTDDVEAKTKSTLEFSVKASQIIDDVLCGRPAKPKVLTTKESSKLSAASEVAKSIKSSSSKRTAQLLEKAKQVCEQSRLKRQIAKEASIGNSNLNCEADLKDFNKEIKQLTERAMSNISGHTRPDSVPRSTIAHHRNQAAIGSTVNSSHYSPGKNISAVQASNYQEKRHTVHTDGSESEPKSDMRKKRDVPSLLGSPTSQDKTKIGKDALKKLVTAPRSRKEQMLVAKMMQNYSKAKSSSRPKLTAESDPSSDLESPLHVEDLPDDVQMQIEQLLEEEAGLDAADSDGEIMDVTELERNEQCYVIDDDSDDLEMAMILEDECHIVEQNVAKDDIKFIEPSDESAHRAEELRNKERDDIASSCSSSHTDTSQNSTQSKRRRQNINSNEGSPILERVPSSKKPRVEEEEGCKKRLNSNEIRDEQKDARKENTSLEQDGNGTVEKLLHISLKEENIRSKMVETDKDIHQLQMLLMQTQQQLQSKIAEREQLSREEENLRRSRLDILRGAVSDKASDNESRSSSQQRPTLLQLNRSIKIKQEETAVVIQEPDTTTIVGSSPDTSPDKVFNSYTEDREVRFKEEEENENIHGDATEVMQRLERTLSQSSADQSGDGEYTAQYLGTLQVDTRKNLFKQLAENIGDLQDTAYVFVSEGDIEPSGKSVDLKDDDNMSTSSFEKYLTNIEANEDEAVDSDEQCNDEVQENKLSDADRTDESGHGEHKKSDENQTNSPVIKLDRFCKVKLERLDVFTDAGNKTSIAKSCEAVQTPVSPADRKKRKTRKERDLSRSKEVSPPSLLSSDGSDTEEHRPDDSMTGRIKRKTKKTGDDPNSKILQEYLHAPSSSDVDLESAGPASENQRNVSAVEPNRLKINSTQLQALRLSAQKTSFGTKASSAESVLQRTKRYEGHRGTVHCLQVYDGSLFSGSEDNTARRFNLETCRCESIYSGHSKGVQCLCIYQQRNSSPKLITGSFDMSIISYNLESDSQEGSVSFASRVLCMCENYGKLFVGLGDGTISVVNLLNMKETDQLHGGNEGVRCIKAGREGTRDLLLVASVNGTISIRDMRSGLFFRSIAGHTKSPLDLQVVNHLVFSASADRTVQIHDINTGEFVKSLSHKGVVTSISVDGRFLYTTGYEGVVNCYNVQTCEKEKMYYGAGKGVITSMAVYGNKLITGAKEGIIESICMDSNEKWICKFGRCGKIFGLRDHLEYHVVRDHVISSQPILKCLWSDCDSYLHVQDQKQETIQHILQHLDE